MFTYHPVYVTSHIIIIIIITTTTTINTTVVVVVIIIILAFNFMQDFYNCIPETNCVSRVYSVAAVLYLQFVLHVMFYNYHYIYPPSPFPLTFPLFIPVDLQPSLSIWICLPRASLPCHIPIFFLPLVWQLFLICCYCFELDFPFGHFS